MTDTSVAGMQGSAFGPLIDADTLAGLLADDPGAVRVVDVRWYLGRPSDAGLVAYREGHLPGAVWLSMDDELADPASPAGGRHPLPSPQRFAAALGRAGIAEGSPVVAYDDSGGAQAARLWWLLHALGEPVAVLDGGLAGWNGPLALDEPAVEPVERPARAWPAAAFADADDVADAVSAGNGRVVVDARTAERFAHGDPAIDPRPGHVPGARSLPWAGNLDATGRIAAPGALRERFAAAGVAADADVVAYCGSGVTACHDLLAMTVAGIGRRLALYPGSWSQWGADDTRPAETGPPA